MLIKEFIQLKRDRVSFAMIIMIPLVQLLLFGYAINTNPRHLPTAVLLQEQSDLGRSILKAHRRTPRISTSPTWSATRPSSTACWPRARCCSRSRFRPISSARCGAATGRRCWSRPTRPTRWPRARPWRRSATWCRPRSRTTAPIPDSATPPFEIRTHARYNPAANTSLNIVPGLVGTILTMTMLIFTALSVTREIERGTMESLLSMPITPVEIMLGKIMPYIIVGFVQAALIIGIGIGLFGVPLLGSLALLALLSTLFITDQSVDRLHLLDHRAEPAAGDADVDDVLPAEHPAVGLHVSVRRHAALGAMDRRMRCRSRIICASCARSCSRARPCPTCVDALALAGLMLVAMTIAVTRFRRTLD